jgi:hypothetical protein
MREESSPVHGKYVKKSICSAIKQALYLPILPERKQFACLLSQNKQVTCFPSQKELLAAADWRGRTARARRPCTKGHRPAFAWTGWQDRGADLRLHKPHRLQAHAVRSGNQGPIGQMHIAAGYRSPRMSQQRRYGVVAGAHVGSERRKRMSQRVR